MDRIVTPFAATSTAAEVLDGLDLRGRRVVVTGGASGIGAATAAALAAAGAEVWLAVRDVAAAEPVATAVGAAGARHLDLADLRSVAAFAASWDGPLDVLVANAGVMATPEGRTAQDHELQLGTNHLGHHALAAGLHGALAASGAARVVLVSSSGHLLSPVVPDDLDYRFRAYDPLGAYGQSKTANVLLAVEAAWRWARDGITANALNPGAIATRLQRHVGGEPLTPAHLRKSVEQGAATSALLAASPVVDAVTGRYFNDLEEAEVVDRRPADVADMPRSVARYAVDPDRADDLWERSEAMVAAG